MQIDALPDACMHVGQTDVRLQDVARYNRGHSSLYELNVNDCRHYVNGVVQLCTGVHPSSMHSAPACAEH